MTCTSHEPGAGRQVSLLDGRRVCSCSREWMRETEARFVLTLGPLRARPEYLDNVRKKRGEGAKFELEALMRDVQSKAPKLSYRSEPSTRSTSASTGRSERAEPKPSAASPRSSRQQGSLFR